MEKINQQKTYLWPIILIIVILVLCVGAGVFIYSHYKQKPSNLPAPGVSKQSEPQKAEVEKAIKSFVLGNSAPTIKDVQITEIKFYTDKQKVVWAKFNVVPLPEGVTDPAYGVMKKVEGKWQSVDFGTCCLEDNLPPDVREGLGFK